MDWPRWSSLEWTGKSLSKLSDAQARFESRRSFHASDWWMVGLPVVALLDLALYLTLHSRPGALGVRLWAWAPAALMVAIALLLVGALVSALRSRRTWTWFRGGAFIGLCLLVPSVTAYLTYPSSHDERPSAVRFQLPLDGPITVAWGGPTLRVNYHVASPGERWAYDLLVTEQGRSHRGDPADVMSYFAYGREVRAPAAGRVHTVHDGDPDAVPGRPDRHRRAGNHIVLEVAPDEYLLIAHLKAGSIAVRPGDMVAAGQVLGRVGNSGNTSEPHVHLHLQDAPVPDAGEGIPLLFTSYRDIATGDLVARGIPEGGQRRGQFLGQIVESAPPRGRNTVDGG
jgi:murein DD-endopeptidase MepM/ murein hydrolase activator NlpD